MKKKNMIITLSFIALLLGISLSVNNNSLGQNNLDDINNNENSELVSDNIENKKSNELILYEVDYLPVKDLADLEERSELIVKVKYKGEREIISFEQNGHIVDTESKSYVDIKQIFKGQESQKTISVFEPAYQKNGKYISMEGYKLMDENTKDYILFLRNSGVGDTYTIIGMYEGKYNLHSSIDIQKLNGMSNETKLKDSQVEYMGNKIDRFVKLKDEVKSKYK